MEKLRAVLVGCGGMSKTWLTAASKSPELAMAGLVDLELERARGRAEEFGLGCAVVGDSLAEILDETKPDVVFDCTLPSAHKSVTLTALEAGCHVLGEKPISDRLEDAREMVKTARDCGKIYAVIQNRRYSRAIRTVREAVARGEIGRLHTVNADFYRGPRFGGFREEMDHVLLIDMAIHSFDQARFLIGADPASVYCHEYNPPSSWFRHGACAMGIFEMSDGSVFNYRGSWCADGLSTSWQCVWRLVGERGTLIWNGEDGIELERLDQTKSGHALEQVKVEWVPWDSQDDGHAGLVREFVDCVRSGGQPMTRGEDNIKSLAMVFAAIQSAEAGSRLPIASDL